MGRTLANRPHRYPLPAPQDGDILAWKCAACGQWVREYEYDKNPPCPVNWRAPSGVQRLARFWVRVGRVLGVTDRGRRRRA